jgi:hypothetical protein
MRLKNQKDQITKIEEMTAKQIESYKPQQKKNEVQKYVEKINNPLKTFEMIIDEKRKQIDRNFYSEKSRREANPQITVRGALVKYVWDNLDVKKIAAEKGMHFIGIPAKIVQMVMTEAMKDHPMKEEDKKSMAHWSAVQKSAMKLLADNINKYVGMVKKA